MKFFCRIYLFSSTNMTLRSSILKEPYSEGDARPERRLTAKAFFLRPTETKNGVALHVDQKWAELAHGQEAQFR